MLKRGRIPDGSLVLHSCDNPSCVNPDHLFLGNQSDNIRDMVSKGRYVGQRRLSVEQVREIRLSFDGQRVLAKRFGISQSQISRVRRRVTYSEVA